MLPTLRITFSELEERSKLLERAQTESKCQVVCRRVENQASNGAVVQESLEDKRSFHLKHTSIPDTTNRMDKRRSSKSPAKSQNVISLSVFEQTSKKKLVRKEREADASTDDSRYFPNYSYGGSSIYPVMQENQTKCIGYDKRRKEEEKVDRSSRSSRLRSKCTGDWPRSDYANVMVELKELTAEWHGLENKGVERNLARWNGDVAKLDPVFETCYKMTGCAEKILSKDVQLFCKLNITSKLWNGALYPVLDMLRGSCSSGVEGCRDLLTRFIASTIEFYGRSLQTVQANFCFKISDLTSGKIQFTSKTQHRRVMLVAVMCHNWYVYLGDLARYQQQLLVSAGAEANWTKPRQYYVRAQQLAPKDGKPYNQLAIIAINTHLRLDAVYYYMRSLATSPPFQSAYDSLVAIFAETGRKAQRQEEDERMDRETEKVRTARKLRKEEQMLKKKQQHRRKQSKRGGGGAGSGGGGSVVNEFSSGKKEIWILPGMVSEDRGVQVEAKTSHDPLELEVESCLVPPTQVMKKVMSAFLVVHGKLFTKTGRETLGMTVQRLLGYLGRLLSGEVRQEYAMLLFKMAVINIYSIHHEAESNTESQSVGACCPSILALQLSLQMAELMLETCMAKLDEQEQSFKKKNSPQFAQSDPYGSGIGLESWTIGDCHDVEFVGGGGGEGGESSLDPILDFFSVVLPAVRIVFDWFLCREEVCVLSVLDPTLLLKFWTTTVSFLNKSLVLLSVDGRNRAEKEDGVFLHALNLWEDRALAGFMPLKADLGTMDTFALPQYKIMKSKQHREQSLARILLLGYFCRQLCGKPHITGATIGYNAVSGKFLVVSEGLFEEVKSEYGEREGERDHEDLVEIDNSLSFGFSGDDESDVIVELSDEEEEEDGEGESLEEAGERDDVMREEEEEGFEIEQLKAQRDGLAKQLEERSLAMAMAKTVLSEAVNKVGEEMQIIPKYLVPDTNCFVDMLPSIKKLVQRADFILGIPLTVVVELEGLSKRTATSSDKKSATKVTSGAKNALDYIVSSFAAKSPFLRALTTQGSLLSSLSFRAEITEKACNDDLILESCLQLHQKTKASSKTGEGVCYKVVLLTDDRNLRVKAHASSLPVKDLPSFMTMLS